MSKANEVSFTPGPWVYHLGRGANPRFHVQTEGGYQIASTTELVHHSQAHEENESRESNARLIAAAPELLAALKVLLPGVIQHHRGETASINVDDITRRERAISAARAAIALATGGAK